MVPNWKNDVFKGILKQAITKAGFMPKTILCNRAGEYVCAEIRAFFKAENMTPHYSNPREQFGNGVSEKFVNQHPLQTDVHPTTSITPPSQNLGSCCSLCH
eukprot:6912-Rhodomonas_salina.1